MSEKIIPAFERTYVGDRTKVFLTDINQQMPKNDSNLFEQVLSDPGKVESQLLGPTYPYYSNIKTPTQIGMSDKGTIQQMSKDVDGLIQYVQLLVTGNSKASKTGRPLGNKFFLKTGAKCSATDQCDKNGENCRKVDRYIYVNNVPAGNVPFISSGMGVNFSEFKGLIPGTMSNLNVLNPFAIMRSFLAGASPPCQPIKMQTINNKNIRSSEQHYVTLADIRSMDPCNFTGGKNPLTGATCKETFTRMSDDTPVLELPDDLIDQLYLVGIGVLGIYILKRVMDKAY